MIEHGQYVPVAQRKMKVRVLILDNLSGLKEGLEWLMSNVDVSS